MADVVNDSATAVGDAVHVVVVGAGPVGLLTAIELALAGARVRVLERLTAPSLAPKAGGLGPLGIEALQRRGMAAAIAAAEARSFAAMGQAGVTLRGSGSKFSGHFAGLSLLRKEAQSEPGRHARAVDQAALEAMLADRAHSLGVQVQRGCEVTRFTQDAQGVNVAWASSAGDVEDEGRVRAAYLVGCDGGRSVVRKLAGFAFDGTPPTSTFYQAMVEVDQAERLLPFGWHHTAHGVFSFGPVPGRLFLLDFNGPPEHRDRPVTIDEMEAALRRISGADVRVTALHSASRWTDHTRLVDTYRRGRVLLAGDAAHVHTPFGGQGLTLGLVDAANLGWKLAAVARGDAPDTLLDTYTAERRPVAEAVLANTLAQIALMRPDPQTSALRQLMATLLGFDDVNRHLGAMTSGVSTRYHLGTATLPVGRLLGDRPLHHAGADTSLFALMQDGASVLLDASAGGAASELAQAIAPQVRCVAIEAGPSLLIRPDACVAWVAEDGGAAGLDEALRQVDFSRAGTPL